jgi:hypothetical protein
MSLLASAGVGVFNHKHFIIDGPSSIVGLRNGSGTHDFVWDCLNAWGDLPSSNDMFVRSVRPHGISLLDWLQPIGGAIAVLAVGNGLANTS